MKITLACRARTGVTWQMSKAEWRFSLSISLLLDFLSFCASWFPRFSRFHWNIYRFLCFCCCSLLFPQGPCQLTIYIMALCRGEIATVYVATETAWKNYGISLRNVREQFFLIFNIFIFSFFFFKYIHIHFQGFFYYCIFF